MNTIGYPLVGDAVYGGKPRNTTPAIGEILMSFPRQALHAEKLALTHPRTEQILEWKAAVPEDMENLLEKLRNHTKEAI